VAAGRVIWMLDAKGQRLEALRRELTVQPAGPLFFCDLPGQPGEFRAGPYVLKW
jgi:hypothetical protein